MGHPRLPQARPASPAGALGGPGARRPLADDPPIFAFGLKGEVPPADTLTLAQVHGAAVFAVSAEGLPVPRPEGDALVTDRPGVAVGVVTADCLPVLLSGPGGRVVAAVHAGWRGTLAGVATAAVAEVESRYGVVPADLTALLGPCIRACCLEVGPEVSAAVREGFPHWAERVLSPGPHGPGARDHLDIVALNALQLATAGVRDVRDRGGCTRCDRTRYHSYRRDGKGAGRMVSWIRAAG